MVLTILSMDMRRFLFFCICSYCLVSSQAFAIHDAEQQNLEQYITGVLPTAVEAKNKIIDTLYESSYRTYITVNWLQNFNKWWQNDRYNDTIFNVILRAIQKCIKQSDEFNPEKIKDGLVSFDAPISSYSFANFNCLFLYNVLHICITMNKEYCEETLQDLLTKLCAKYGELYKDKLHTAKSQIDKYMNDIGLRDYINAVKGIDPRIRFLRVPSAEVWNIFYKTKSNKIGELECDKSSPLIVNIKNYYPLLNKKQDHEIYFITNMEFSENGSLRVRHDEVNVVTKIATLFFFTKQNIDYFYKMKLLDYLFNLSKLDELVKKDETVKDILQNANRRIDRYLMIRDKYNLFFKFSKKAKEALEYFYRFICNACRDNLYSDIAKARYVKRFTSDFISGSIKFAQDSACLGYEMELSKDYQEFFDINDCEVSFMNELNICSFSQFLTKDCQRYVKKTMDRRSILFDKQYKSYKELVNVSDKEKKEDMSISAFMRFKTEQTIDIPDFINAKL